MSKILIVSSDFNFTSLLEARLLIEDHRVAIAGDGVQGLQMAQELEPDVIVLDVALPKMSGYRLVEKLKAPGQPLRDIPIIVVTERIRMGHMFRCIDIFHFCAKPVNPVQFIKQIEAAAKYVPLPSNSDATGTPEEKPVSPRVVLGGIQRYMLNKIKDLFEEKGFIVDIGWDEGEVLQLVLQIKPHYIFLQFGQSLSEFNAPKVMSMLMQKKAIQQAKVFSFCPKGVMREAEFLLSPAKAIGYIESRDLLKEIERKLGLGKIASHRKETSS